MPAICRSFSCAGRAAWHRVEQPARVRVPRRAKHVLRVALLDDAPGVHDTTMRSASPAITDRSRVIQSNAAPVSRDEFLHVVEDLPLDRDIERGGGLVGDDQIGPVEQRNRDRHPLPHARRRAGAGTPSAARSGEGTPTFASASRARARAAGRGICFVGEDGLDHLRVDAQHRV